MSIARIDKHTDHCEVVASAAVALSATSSSDERICISVFQFNVSAGLAAAEPCDG
jgi:hypothetical protein